METIFDETKLTFGCFIDAVADAVLIVDDHGIIVRANCQVEALLGYTQAELVGRPIEILVPVNLREIHTKYRNMFDAEPVKRPMGTMLALSAVTKEGRLIPVDISLNPIQNNGHTFVMVLLRDISVIVNAYEETLAGWSRAMDFRDKETENHTQRVTDLTVRVAKSMNLTETQITHMRRGALLHDIGKMGIPDDILNKQGKLTSEEWVVMRRHPEYAYEMLNPIEFLRPALDIPYCHHEKWDGSGYPRGLKGEEIPIAARIFAVVDVWDALSSDRPYRKAMPKEEVCAYIRSESGTHFDPRIVDIFLNLICSQKDKEAVVQPQMMHV